MTETKVRRNAKLPAAGWWLLGGSAATTVGNAMHTFTVGLILYADTGSVAAFGFVIMVEQALTFLVQAVAGPWIDTGDPRKVAIWVEMIRGSVVCICAILVALTGNTLVLILIMTIVMRVAQPFYRAAMFSIGPLVIPADNLHRFNGWSNSAIQVGQFAGVIAAAPVYSSAGPAAAFLFNGVSFLLSALAIVFVRVPHRQRFKSTPGKARQIIVGWQEIWVLVRSKSSVRWLLALNCLDAVAVNLFNVLSVPLVALHFAGSAYGLTLIECGFAIGAMIAGGAVAPLAHKFGNRVNILIAMGGQAVCFASLAITSLPSGLIIVLCFGLGAFNTVSWSALVTALQLEVAPSVRGRIGTARNLLTALFTAAVIPITTFLSDHLLSWAFLFSAILCLAFTFAAALASWRGFGRAGLFEATEHEEDGKES